MKFLSFLMVITLLSQSASAGISRESTTEIYSELGLTTEQIADIHIFDPGSEFLNKLDETVEPRLIEEEKVDLKGLRIVGRGMLNRKNGSFLALACVGEFVSPDSKDRNCNLLQHVYYNKLADQTKLVGQKYLVSESATPTAEETTATLKTLKENYIESWKAAKREKRSDPAHQQKVATYLAVAGVLVFIVFPLTMGLLGKGAMFFYSREGVAAASGSGWVAPLLISAGFGISIAAFLTVGAKPVFATSATDVQNISNQDGWSWATKPKKVSNKAFNLYLSFL